MIAISTEIIRIGDVMHVKVGDWSNTEYIWNAQRIIDQLPKVPGVSKEVAEEIGFDIVTEYAMWQWSVQGRQRKDNQYAKLYAGLSCIATGLCLLLWAVMWGVV